MARGNGRKSRNRKRDSIHNGVLARLRFRASGSQMLQALAGEENLLTLAPRTSPLVPL
jgi:hypothetical protein